MLHKFSLLLAATAILSAPAFAKAKKVKDPCSGVSASQDAFAKTRTFSAGYFTMVKTNDDWSMRLSFKRGGGYGGFAATTSEIISEGTDTEFMLEDGSTIALKTSAQSGPTQNEIMGVQTTTYALPFSVSADDLTHIAASPIKVWRVLRGTESWQTGEVKEKDAKAFTSVLACMLEKSPF